MKRIAQGAEAILSKDKNKLIKDRVEKGYRHAKIDSRLRKLRTKAEARLLRRARQAGVLTPDVLNETEYSIEMEFIDGKRLKDVLDEMDSKSRAKLLKGVGKGIALLHSAHIIHGDLTTSNMLLTGKDIYFIDFGLGEVSPSIEKMATDLHLLKEVFRSTHYRHFKSFNHVISGYKWDRSKDVLKRMEEIESRGRYK
ncbi:KEOPS complex kinase/ATPase Bud32 [Candidatus Undinarchaeota archaeon]